jgi:paraquat-inducible protein B
VNSANALLAAEDTKDLPAALTGALSEVQSVLAELRAGGTVDNANRTLASAAAAADALAQSSEGLPALVQRVEALIADASQTLTSFDSGSDLNQGARSALREVQRAAEAISSLARAIERRPNSLILGR